MSLITCPDCQKEISDQATMCLNCGRPVVEANKNTQNSGWVVPNGFGIGGIISLFLTIILTSLAMNTEPPTNGILIFVAFIFGIFVCLRIFAALMR